MTPEVTHAFGELKKLYAVENPTPRQILEVEMLFRDGKVLLTPQGGIDLTFVRIVKDLSEWAYRVETKNQLAKWNAFEVSNYLHWRAQCENRAERFERVTMSLPYREQRTEQAFEKGATECFAWWYEDWKEGVIKRASVNVPEAAWPRRARTAIEEAQQWLGDSRTAVVGGPSLGKTAATGELKMTDEAMSEMPKYQCHKKVWALKIKNVMIDPDANYSLVFEDARYAPRPVSQDFVKKHNPNSSGYFVVYDDGYQSFSPAKAFEEGYTLLG